MARSFSLLATHLVSVLALGVAPLSAQSGPLPEPGQRVALVTGSTSGLGREVARSLAGEGAHVIIHGRSAERGLALVEEINGQGRGSARFYQADFASLEQGRQFAAVIRRDYDRLQVLVNNAGVIVQERRMSQDGYELTFQVNYLAHYLLTEELMPLLRESAPARIVNVSSIASAPIDWSDPMALESPYDAGAAYGRSKRAQAMHAVDLAEELEGSGVIANSLHPETFMDTNMVLSMGAQPRSSVLDGRDNVLQLIDGEVGSGDFYLEGEPSRAIHDQAWDANERARLKALAQRLVVPPEQQLDSFWAEVSRTVAEGDFDGYAALYHPDAVLVTSAASRPIAAALGGWEQGFIDTREGRTTAQVSFRMVERRLSGTTAHEEGVFRYAAAPAGEDATPALVHFEALLVKKGSGWLMTMEYQREPATAAEWEEAGATGTPPG